MIILSLILKTYIFISCVTFITYVLFCANIASKILKEHPELKSKRTSTNFIEKTYPFVRALIVSFIPIFNVAVLFVIVFSSEFNRRCEQMNFDELEK